MMKRITTSLVALLAISGISEAKQVQMDVALANPFLEAGKKNTTYLKVGLTGFELTDDQERTPVNVALVIDKSSSMSGEKIVQARNAAKMAIERLREDDIVSIVTYDSNVQVMVPATKLTDKAEILRRIDELEAGGSTALFAGVSKGATELRKFLTNDRVNRVILLSDGQANVGPKSPGELGELGESLVKEGISVSTIGLGLGYNEDLMVKLAFKSDGNHIFVEDEDQLVAIFDEEFGDILSVVAQEVVVEINCAPGIRPVRMLGREADISGQRVITMLNQLYSSQEKYILLEVDVPEGKPDASRQVATVNVSYANMSTQTTDELASTLGVRFTASAELAASEANEEVMEASVLLIATDRNKLAVKLRDEGKVKEAKVLLTENAIYLEENAQVLESKKLSDYAISNRGDAENVDKDWGRQRKAMIQQSYTNTIQQKDALSVGNLTKSRNDTRAPNPPASKADKPQPKLKK
ncbi:MAG: VWA domain-containing protein [Verrucomicrobiota bacterium]